METPTECWPNTNSTKCLQRSDSKRCGRNKATESVCEAFVNILTLTVGLDAEEENELTRVFTVT